MYTLIAQDDLNTLGFSTGGLDGIFGANTQNAVKRYQTSRGLTSDRYNPVAILGVLFKRMLSVLGRTATTLD